MRTKTQTARERRPGRQSNTNETNEFDRGLTNAVRRSSQAVSDKIDQLMREKYSDLNDQNA
jgi:hypothetical protein